MKTSKLLGALLGAAGMVAAGQASAQALDKLEMVVFGPPSLGAFLPPIIKAKKLDEKNGLQVTFTERPPDAYTVQFNTGEFQVGGSAALLTVGLAATRGVDVQYLFNVFDYWSYVVTNRDDIKTLKDIEGKDMAAAKSTSSYRIFTWFAKQQGVDMDKVSVVNTAPPGLVSYAVADRAAAVHMWSPGYDVLMARKKGVRTIDLKINEIWKKMTGNTNIPYLGVAAHTKWINENQKLVPKLYNTYKDAAAWVLANPDEAAKLIEPKGTPESQKAVADLIRANDRLGMKVTWASESKKELSLIYKVGMETGIMPSDPGLKTLYSGPEK
ncbi:MAG: ABC transporter substrate-binding protein [Pseudolabrys sp.]